VGRDVRAEQVRTLYGQSLPLLIGNAANGAIVAAVLWATQDHGVISVWLGTVLLVTGARAALWRAFVALAPGTDAVPAWGIRYSISVALSGAAWGSASLLFLEPDRPLSVALIGFLIGGMGAAAAGTLACYVPAFVAYAVPLLAPLAYRTLVADETALRGMGVLVVVYAVMLTTVARITNRSVRRSLELRFENDALVARLSSAQLDLEKSNQVLEERVQERARQIEEQGEALRRAQRLQAIGRLAGGIAHDFNNLLTVVLSNASSLLSELRDARQRGVVEEIQVAGQRGADLVRQLLSFSGKQPDERYLRREPGGS
jgi:signal transduction histidine kinase